MDNVFIVNQADAGRRIDVYVMNESSDLSRSAVQRFIVLGCITVNGKPVQKSYQVRLGDEVICDIPPPKPCGVEPEDIPLEIVYEDSSLIVINKPRGIVVHPAHGHMSGTVVNALLYRCEAALSGVGGVLRPGIVHRLDKDTSGLLVAAKTDKAHRSLAIQLAARSVLRKYQGIACGNIKKDAFTIDRPVGRHPTQRKKMAVVINGRRAVTHFCVLERYGKYTLFEARLETGRTHQIRVHLAHTGHPLLGDALYGGEARGYEGQILHAKTLGFAHPDTGSEMLFDTELPPYFVALFHTLHFF